MAPLAHFIYVAEGFMEDCRMLIRTLTDKYEKVDWNKFCLHWKELQFDLMFYNRRSGAELVELTEECFQCARLYMVTETNSYEDQVIGIFIAYAISIIQPYKNLCSLRLVPEDMAPMKKVEARARLTKRNDVLMILGRLYVYSTHFHVCTRERAMDFGIRKYFDDSIKVPKSIVVDWHGGLNRTHVRNWNKIHELEKRVFGIRTGYAAYCVKRFPGCTVEDLTVKPLADDLAASLQNLVLGTKKEKVEESKDLKDSLKKKAMMRTVDPVRHFTPIDQRQAAPIPLPLAAAPTAIQPKTVVKSVRFKIKENSQNVIVGKELQQYTALRNNLEPKIEAELNELPSHTLDNSKVHEVNSSGSSFKGFTAEEIESANASLSNSDLDSSRIKKRKKKRKNTKQLSTSDKTSHTDLDNSDLEIPNLNNVQKRKATPKQLVKNKKKRGSKLFDESDSNTNDNTFDSDLLDDDCEIKPKETIKAYNTLKKIPTEEMKVEDLVKRELKDDPKFVRDFVQYKVKDIVIHADQGLPDLEFELIDEYTGPVNEDKAVKAEGITDRRADLSLPDLGFESIDPNTGPGNKVKTAKKTKTVNHANLDLPDLGFESIDQNTGPVNKVKTAEKPKTFKHADLGLPDVGFESIDPNTGPVNKVKTAKKPKIFKHADLDLPDLGFKSIDPNTGSVNKVNTEEKTKTTVRHAGLNLPDLGPTVDTAINEHDKPANTNGEPMDIQDDGEEMVEVVRILTESEVSVIETRESLVVPRRQLKRPSLKSKLRRMGILPVANFYDDDVEES